MTARILVDTNVILYTLDPRETAKRPVCVKWLKTLIAQGSITISPQVCNEVRSAGVRRLNLPAGEVRTVVRNLLPFCTAPLTAAEIDRALEIEQRYRASWWDAVLLASAIGAGCTHFLTEDGQSAPVIEGVKIVNPFASEPADIVAA